jgi:N-formylglutamate amidohydrolase
MPGRVAEAARVTYWVNIHFAEKEDGHVALAKNLLGVTPAPPRAWWSIALVAALFVATSLTFTAAAQDKSPASELKRLITIETGEIPIILSAPHGGSRSISGVPARKGETAKQFVTVTDTNTHRLTQALAAALEKKWGKPTVTIAHFSRRYLDANRPAEDAYESESAKPIYDAYHESLRKAVERTREKWGRGLLLDIHGQAAEKATLFRGTANGQTCSLLLERLGPDGLMGKEGLLGRLHDKGYLIHPEPGSKAKEDSRYSGGHIVRTYGASGGTGIDAVQFELGGDFRKESTIQKTASDLADAICQFANLYFEDSIPQKSDSAP